MRFFIILIYIISFHINAQNSEIISFNSANPFSLSDIIKDLENQQQQEVFGKLTLPIDSANYKKKFPLIIGVAGSLGWRPHHHEYCLLYTSPSPRD